MTFIFRETFISRIYFSDHDIGLNAFNVFNPVFLGIEFQQSTAFLVRTRYIICKYIFYFLRQFQYVNG